MSRDESILSRDAKGVGVFECQRLNETFTPFRQFRFRQLCWTVPTGSYYALHHGKQTFVKAEARIGWFEAHKGKT